MKPFQTAFDIGDEYLKYNGFIGLDGSYFAGMQQNKSVFVRFKLSREMINHHGDGAIVLAGWFCNEWK